MLKKSCVWGSAFLLNVFSVVKSTKVTWRLANSSLTRMRCSSFRIYPADIFMFKVNKENTRTMCEICSKFAVKTPELPR